MAKILLPCLDSSFLMNILGRKLPFNLVHFIIVQLFLTFKSLHCSSVVPLDKTNFDSTINTTEVVFVNFFADWCHFSQRLAPIFEEAAGMFNNNSQVKFGSVDCDNQHEVAQIYGISKYPTLKLFRFGQLAKREYRGSRTAESMYKFIEEQTKDNINRPLNNEELMTKLDLKKRNVIAYLLNENSQEWMIFRRVAGNLREDCEFHVIFGVPGQTTNRVIYKPPEGQGQDLVYNGVIDNSTTFQDWVSNNCIPLVREITFENAEELTEEGLPFLILFKHPDDKDSLNDFTQVVQQLQDQKNSINFLYADGIKFAHPLHHLGKTQNDLPLIAIDSFRHMYLFPEFKDLKIAGKLRQFVDDMHSGKLHREFHHGPDPTEATPEEITAPPTDTRQAPTDDQPQQHHEHPSKQEIGRKIFGQEQKTSPPVSIFNNLKPSRMRYSMKDEL